MADKMEFNDAFFERLGKSAGVTALCVAKAEQVAARARSTAPVDTAAYRGSISVRVVERSRRNAAVVTAADWKSLLIESKTGNLARALKAVGRG